jgi:hypothetical protein
MLRVTIQESSKKQLDAPVCTPNGHSNVDV